MILIPVFIYPISLLLSRKAVKEKRWVLAFVLYLVAVQTIPAWISGVDRAAECYFQEEETSERTDTEGKVVKYVVSNSSENERIIVLGNWNIIYVLSKRLPASMYSYQMPIINNDNKIQAKFYEELKLNNPKIVIVSQEIEGAEQFLADNKYTCTKEIDGIKIYMQN